MIPMHAIPGILAVVLANPAHAKADCVAWNTAAFFFKAAMVVEQLCTRQRRKMTTGTMVAALVMAGASVNVCTEDNSVPFDLIAEDPPLKGSDVYWMLNNARFQ